MEPAAAVTILAVVLIILALVVYLVAVILELRKITSALDVVIGAVGEIVSKSAPVNDVVKAINADLSAGSELLEGLLEKKAGPEDAAGLVESLFPGGGVAMLERQGRQGEVKNIDVVYTRGAVQLARLGRVERAGRIVDKDARRAELTQMKRALQQHVGFPRRAGAVHEPDRQLLPGAPDGLGGLPQIADVVQGIVQPEHVDAASGRACHEAPDDVVGDGPRADEEAPAQSHPERGGATRADRADALPGALDAASHGAVETPAARDLHAARSAADLADR